MKKVVLFLLINCLLVSSLLIGCDLSVQNNSSYDATQDLPDGMAVDDNAVSGDCVDGTTRVDNRLIDLSVELGKLSDDESRKELADSVLNELVETNLISDLSFDEETYSYSFVYVDTGNLGGIMLRESDSVDTISDNAASDDDIAPLHVIVDAYPYTTGMATIEYGEGKITEYTPEPDTKIRVYMLWYGSDSPVDISPQYVTDVSDTWRGDKTIVEWGGSQIR